MVDNKDMEVGKEPKEMEPQKIQEAEGEEGSILMAIQDLADMVKQLGDRITNIEQGQEPVETDEPEMEPEEKKEQEADPLDKIMGKISEGEPLSEEEQKILSAALNAAKEEGMYKDEEGMYKDKEEEALDEKPSPEKPNDMDKGQEPGELTGIPEREEGEPSTSGDSAIRKQTDTGEAPGGSLDENPDNEGDDKGASGKVRKPSKDYNKPDVKKNSLEEDEAKEESFIDKTLRELKENLSNEESYDTEIEGLESRQSVAVKKSESVSEDNNEFLETKEKTNGVIKEYLQKAGIYNQFIK